VYAKKAATDIYVGAVLCVQDMRGLRNQSVVKLYTFQTQGTNTSK
jgi:hypothetical protein